MTPPIDAHSDAALVHRFLAGDRGALGDVYDRYAQHLYAFCRSMLRRDADAQDALQDVFVIAATRLSTLREPDRLRSWLFTIAKRECLARTSHARREVPVDEVPDRPGTADDEPAQHALDAELSAILAAAIDGLGDRDRMLLDLADRHGLPTDEVAEVVGMAPDSAYKAIVRARTTARRAIGALLVARTNRSRCTGLAALLPDWSGDLTPLLRKRLARHIEECDTCLETERRVADPRVLLGALPMPMLPPIREHILHTALSAMPAPGAAAGSAGSGSPASSGSSGTPPSSVTSYRVGRSSLRPPGAGQASTPPPDAGQAAAAAPTHGPSSGASRRAAPGHRARRGLTIAGLVVLLLIACATIPLLIASAPRPRTTGSAGIALAPAPVASATPAPTTPSAGGRTTTRSGGKPPQIMTLSVACVFHADTKTDVPELTWEVTNATGIALSVNDPSHPGSAGHFGTSGTMVLTGGSCNPKDGPQTATIRTTGGTGPAATGTVTWNEPASPPPPSPSPSPSATVTIF